MSDVQPEYGTPTKPKMNGQREKCPYSEDVEETNHAPMKKKKIPKKKLVGPEGGKSDAKRVS